MPLFPRFISIGDLIAADSLFADFVSTHDGAARRLLGAFDATALGRRRETRRGGDSAARSRFAERLSEYNRSIGVSAAIVDRVGGLVDGQTRVVITGQQPGVLGGPLMTLHKIETACALAEVVEATQGVPCVPVYWMGADDADFAEIREVVLLGADHHALSTSLPTGAHEAGMPVGDIATRWLAGLWDGLDAFVAGAAGAARMVGRAIASGEDHAGVTARIVAGLTRGRVLVVDGREARLRECAREVILEYLDREDEIRACVEAGGRALEVEGFRAQLSLGPDSGVFLLEGGRRVKVGLERRAELRRRLDGRIADASPGVVLRNLVQDVVFDPVAVVLGPAEIAYRAQIRGVYDLVGIEPPVAFPRLFGTYVPPGIAALVEATGADPAGLVRAPAEFVSGVFRSESDADLEAARDRLQAAAAAAVEDFIGAAAGRLDAASLDKTRKRLADVTRRLEPATAAVGEVGRARALARWPFLDGIPDVFARRGERQERYLSMLTPFLTGGSGAGDAVRGAARAHVEAAMDGRIEHAVYSN
jgi:hypothetical protein